MNTKNLFLAAALIHVSACPAFCGDTASCAYDVLIKGGLVYDGSDAPPSVMDVGIMGDRIAAVGKDLAGPAAKTIVATGLIVIPGIIDCHNHTDLAAGTALKIAGDSSLLTQYWKENRNYATQGVTTMVTGLCGMGLWDTRQWLDLLKAEGFAGNIYHLAPYGMLRMKLFGDNQPTALTAAQLDTLKKLVEHEMRQGALGISVGLEYAPDCFTTTDELVEIAKVVKKYGGIYDAHIRDETGIAGANGRPGQLNSIDETIEIARRAKIAAHISHIQHNLPWNGVTAEQMAAPIEKARAQGLDVTADQHPYEAGYAVISYRLPAEFKIGGGVNPKYKTPEGRARMQDAIKQVFTFLGPEKIMLTSGPENYRSKTVADIAAAEGRDPAEVYVDLSCLEPVPYALFFEISDSINRELMSRDYVFTCSDGYALFGPVNSPHPRFLGCFPWKVKHYAMEEKLLTLQAAIRSMTSLPAKKFNLKGRGTIAAGSYADVAVIDLARYRSNATYAERNLLSEGVVYLLVNGVASIDNGLLTGQRGGRACVLENNF